MEVGMTEFKSKVTQHLQEIINLTQLEISNQRNLTLSKIPKFSLDTLHCDGAKLVSNRKDLISRLPSEGVVAELGADEGSFSVEIVSITNPQKFIIVDAWHTNRYGDDKANKVKELFEKQIIDDKIKIVRSLSVEAADQFDDNYFDWIYIDTDHSYETTIAELFAYERTIKPGGYICGHDYAMGNWASGYKYGVIEAVAEFCVKRNWKIAYITADYTENPSFAIRKI